MAFKTMKEVRKYLDEVHRKLQEVPDGNFFKLADKLGLDVLHDFAKSDLSYTDLSNGNLENADFSHTKLSNANLSGANLKNANLSHAILLKADLSGADLSGATLLNAALNDTNFSEVKYNSTTKFPEDFSPEDSGLWSYRDFSDADLSGANLKHPDSIRSILLRTCMSSEDSQGTTLLKADPQDATFRQAKNNSLTNFPEDFSPEDFGLPEQEEHTPAAPKTTKAPKTTQMFAIAGLGEVYQSFAEGRGRIKFHGSFWRAQLYPGGNQSITDQQDKLHRFTPGELVLVVGRAGLTLLVQPYDDNLPADVLEPGSAP